MAIFGILSTFLAFGCDYLGGIINVSGKLSRLFYCSYSAMRKAASRYTEMIGREMKCVGESIVGFLG